MPVYFGSPIDLFGLFFLVIVVIIVVNIAKGIGQWSYNNGQPVLSSPAQVVAKRTNTSGGGGVNNTSSVRTWYYATFDIEGSERQEFSVSGREYGMLAEGDRGTLSFQGTRYKGFARG